MTCIYNHGSQRQFLKLIKIILRFWNKDSEIRYGVSLFCKIKVMICLIFLFLLFKKHRACHLLHPHLALDKKIRSILSEESYCQGLSIPGKLRWIFLHMFNERLQFLQSCECLIEARQLTMMISFCSGKRRSTSKVHTQFCRSQFIIAFLLSFMILVIFRVCLIVILESVPMFYKIVFDSNFIKCFWFFYFIFILFFILER